MASKEDPAPQESQRRTTVKKRVHDWKLTRPAKARAEICTKGWFKFYGGKRSPDHAIRTICVQPEAWESCEVFHGKRKTTTNLVDHFNCDRLGHRERYRALKGLDIDVNHDPSTVTGG